MRSTVPMAVAPRDTSRAGRGAWSLLLACLLLLVQAPAHAELSERDLQVLARTLGFLDPPLGGELTVGIAYDPASTAATLDATVAQELMSTGLRVGNLVLHGMLVPIPDAANADVDLFLLAAGSGSRAAELVPVLQQRGLSCISADLEQVRAGNCIVGTQSAPRVEILVNSDLAHACKTTFASVFRMMIKEF